MTGERLGLQEYLETYLPSLIQKRLEEKPVPGMEGTEFTLQINIEGESSLAYGITIKDGREIAVAPGGLDNPMLSINLTEDFIHHIVDQVASFTGRDQYDAVSKAKGLLKFDITMPGDWTTPVALSFNGADSPHVTISGSSNVFSRIAGGELNGPQAFMQGQIKLDGDMAFVLSLANLMPG
ncbi:MAG: SCP2 sterol-binding domain-containing protein [Actinomycetota bacterium]|nr:SCP2 sterol-binding domain-containing protein [Actinomycetota bacterium]